MTYASRRPRMFVPRNQLFVPNMLLDGEVDNGSRALPNTATTTANRAYYIPFSAPYDTAVKSIALYVGTANGNYDIGLYDAAGTRLGSLGSTAQAGTGLKTWTPSTPIGVTADTQYFAACGSSSATSTLLAINSASRNIWFLIQDTAFALPSSWTTPTTNVSAATPCPILRITFSN